jgi:dihydroneopterin aldolase/2-amino-4-hydroxy-6-hydroxymethyldihydropteridine diphosphokinase/dihydropteroate synthase
LLSLSLFTHSSMPDRITVAALSCHLAHGAGPSAFGLTPPPPCPLELELDIDLLPNVVPHCVDEDDMKGLGVNYSSVSKAVYAAVADPARVWVNPSAILREAAVVALKLPAVAGVTVRARLPRALLQAQSADYTQYFPRATSPHSLPPPTCTIRDLRVACVIGLHPHERAERQRLEADITVDGYETEGWSHRALADQAFKVRSQFVLYLTSVAREVRVWNTRVPRRLVCPAPALPTDALGAQDARGRDAP